MIEDEVQDELKFDESLPSDTLLSDSELTEYVSDSAYADEAEAFESVELDQEEVPETDITFECPHCGKYLSIDPRGAGLVIQCTMCGQPVTVPIPEGMEIDDLDAEPEELSIQLFSSRQNLAKAQARIAVMEQELDELRESNELLRSKAEDDATMFSHVRVQLSEAARLQGEANAIIREVAAMLTESD